MPARTVYLIKRIETEVTTRMNKALAVSDITLSQFTVLNFVNDHPDDLSSAQLSRRFSMTPQSMSEVVSSLQRKKLIDKKTDVDNKRVLLITLTEKGKTVLKQCNDSIDKVENVLFSSMPDSDLQIFRVLIGAILADIRSHE